MMIDTATEGDLMKSLVDEYKSIYGVTREPGDVTALEFAAQLHISDTAAREFLNAKVKSGDLMVMKEIGTKMKLYRKAKSPSQ